MIQQIYELINGKRDRKKTPHVSYPLKCIYCHSNKGIGNSAGVKMILFLCLDTETALNSGTTIHFDCNSSRRLLGTKNVAKYYYLLNCKYFRLSTFDLSV